MDLLADLALGFHAALLPTHLLHLLAGCMVGTLVGVLPGVGPAAAIALLLPAAHATTPLAALTMLAGIYYGAQYSGSTPAILLNRAGASSSVAASVDGYQIARQGRAGVALTSAAVGSFLAGCTGTLVLALCASPIAEFAFRFGPAEYFSLVVAALVGAVVLASGSTPKAVAMVLLGLLLGWLASAPNAQPARAVLLPVMRDGPQLFTLLAMGFFAIGPIIGRLAEPHEEAAGAAPESAVAWPTRQELRSAVPAMLRGTVIGSLLGVLPGGGALLASFAAYAFEKSLPLQSGEIDFGKGNPRGVAAPESANNAGAQTSFIPLLTLGIPPNGVLALVVGAMLMHGIQPGPQVMATEPGLFWGLVASMWIGNAMLLAMNLPLMPVWARVAATPRRWVFPAVVLASCVGAYTLANDINDVWLLAASGLVGHVFIQLGCEAAPLMLGVVLGPVMEESLRRALQLSNGDWSIFVTRPLSAGFLAIGALLLVLVALPSAKSGRASAFGED